MIVEFTNYYASRGDWKAVLECRRKATAIRLELGLVPGEILVNAEGGAPQVRWQCRFPDRDAYERDRAARRSSEAFEANKKAMHGLIDRFERQIYEIDDGD